MKPHKSKLFYVPQRPYMTLGTLRDQVTYPDSQDDQLRKGISDQALEDFLSKVLNEKHKSKQKKLCIRKLTLEYLFKVKSILVYLSLEIVFFFGCT